MKKCPFSQGLSMEFSQFAPNTLEHHPSHLFWPNSPSLISKITKKVRKVVFLDKFEICHSDGNVT